MAARLMTWTASAAKKFYGTNLTDEANGRAPERSAACVVQSSSGIITVMAEIIEELMARPPKARVAFPSRR